MSRIRIIDGNGSWHFTVNGYALDLKVDPCDGYQLRERIDRNCVPIAHKVRHLLGKQVVTAPKTMDQITEDDLLRAIEAVI